MHGRHPAVKRREFITLLGGAAAAWPAVGRAQQQAAMPVIGFLRQTSLADSSRLVTAFRRGLNQADFVEGKNVAIEYRWAENQRDRLPALVADLIRRSAAVIVGDTNAALATKAATTTLAIVFATGGDPVRDGLVASLNRPGGNVTGAVFFGSVLAAKRLELLHQLVPKATTVAMLVSPNTPVTEAERRDVLAAAEAIGLQLIVLDASSVGDIEIAFTTFVQLGAGALFVGTGTFTFANRERIVALAARHALPAVYSTPIWAEAGGLMSYGSSITDAYHRSASMPGGF
jgi:putative ABC transport system substrate-binding protein